jgi:dTDP-4-dehydrorhamnose 3,5-epimerase
LKFKFTPLRIPEVLLIEHELFADGRGFFAEVYRQEDFSKAGIPALVQENHSRSAKGVLRGLHYQKKAAAQGKLVRCPIGRIFDVAVDIRKGSPTYGQWVSAELSDDNRRMLYVPPGFAHGFCVVSETADLIYKVTDYFSPQNDRGILWSDPGIGIAWPITAPLVSEKDSCLPFLSKADNDFVWQAV